jgi:hypothetical protein
MAHLRDYYQCFLATPALVKELKTFNENAANLGAERKRKVYRPLEGWIADRLWANGIRKPDTTAWDYLTGNQKATEIVLSVFGCIGGDLWQMHEKEMEGAAA